MSKPVSNHSNGAFISPVAVNKKKPPGFWQNVSVGSISGIFAVSLIQPMLYLKNKKQSKGTDKGTPLAVTSLSKFSVKDKITILYRGGGGFAASFIPTTALQTAVNGVLATRVDPLIAASTAGIISAIVVCPAEVIMIQQQNTGKGFFATTRYIYSAHSIQGFYRAFTATAIREGVFAAAYLGAAPLLKERIHASGINEWVARLIAGVVAGALATVVSHPFDTFKTRNQGDFSMKMSILKGLFQKNAFAGFGWRIVMVMTATTVMPIAQEKLNSVIEYFKH